MSLAPVENYMKNNQLLTDIAAIPTVSSGALLSSEAFELNLTVRKYSGDLTKKTSYIWKSCEKGPLIEVTSEVKFRSFSPDGQTLLIGKSSGEKDRYIEIWTDGGNRFVSSINVANIHGDFCSDGKTKMWFVLTVSFYNILRSVWVFFLERKWYEIHLCC